MPRPRTVYRGKRKYSWIITLVVFVLVVLILVAAWLFSYLQRYIVYDKDSLQLLLPSERMPISAQTDAPRSVPKVDVEIVVVRVDYSDLVTDAGRELAPLRALYVPAEDVTAQNLNYYALGNLGDRNALVLELKGADGFLRWHSGVALADSYGVNGTLEPAEALAALKAQDIRLIAELSALTDETMAVRNSPVALKNIVTGSVFRNSQGAWLDPYSETVREYLASLLRELRELGFDEVLLDGIYCPATENLLFSQEMTATPDAVSAVSALALYLRREADTLGLRLSAVAETEALASGEGEAVGQDAEIFFRLFDRVAYDTAAEGSDLCASALETALGSDDGNVRILPIAEDNVPAHESYIVK